MGLRMPFVLTERPKYRFLLVECKFDEFTQTLERLSEEGWTFSGADLRAEKPRALLLKCEMPEPTPEELDAAASSFARAHGPSPMDQLFGRIERIAGFLEKQMGIPPDEKPPGDLD